MNVIIDIGNSLIKTSVFNNQTEIDQAVMPVEDQARAVEMLKKHNYSDQCIICNTGELTNTLLSYCKSNFSKVMILDHQTPLPVKIVYETPDTLGMDRIAAAAGAAELFPDRHVLIIDLGSAITYDIKTKNNVFEGGNISPGLKMRYRALNEFTDKLPLVDASKEFALIGTNTNNAIISGVQNGIIYEVERTIEEFSAKYPELQVILTGGDARFFVNKLKKTIFVVSNLVSVGLNSILIYNV